MMMTQFSFTQIYPEKNDIPTSLPFVVAASISQTYIWDSSGSENVNKRRSDTKEAWSEVNRDVIQETAIIGMTAITSLDGLSYKWTCFRSTSVSDVIVKS